MTSKISLFNKGIYKSTVRRYMWGSVLYFIILFMLTSMIILFDVDKDDTWRYMEQYGEALILDDVCLFFPQFVAYFVPTVVALLIFRFVHSKKTSVFVHSLPVSRTANYISSVLAGFTLMAAPVILNGVILIILSLTGYGLFFDVASCFVWMGINLLTIFLMFSASCFVSMLTGNSFAMVGLNGLIHCIVLILTAAFAALAACFVYGYYDTNQLLYSVMEWNFVAYLIDIANKISFGNTPPFDWSKFIIMIVCAKVFYVLGWLLYKKRRMETAEEVAAFKCLNPIYKYLVTFTAALGAFALLSEYLADNLTLPILVTLIVSIVVYFAAEMILKKTFKVWRAYKGYGIFAVVFAAVICVFAFTNFFGYETRIPDGEKVEKVAIYQYYHQDGEPNMSDAGIIEYAIDVHNDLTQKENIYTVKDHPDYNYDTALHIKYKLKNGRTISRRYPVSEAKAVEVMENLYKSKNYKMKHSEVFRDDIGEIYQIELNNRTYIKDREQIEALYSAMRQDVLELDFTQINAGSAWSISFRAEYIRADEMELETDHRGIYSIYDNINANYKNTLKWLKDNGYGYELFNPGEADLCILDTKQWDEYTTNYEVETASYGRGGTVDIAKMHNFDDMTGVERISDSARKKIVADFVTSHGVRYAPEKEYKYYVCLINFEGYLEVKAAFYEDGQELIRLLNE